ncbi:MAG TPA: hypothetical protein VMW58_14020 [Anaerolineae bacterium]|nr:hypothetical protein [Anaerolineae bacterium]
MKTVYFRAELLFPHESVPALMDVGNGQWQNLVKRVADLPETHEDALAFTLMMIRLCGCLRCNPGSYKASLGCSACGRRIIGMNRESDDDLIAYFQRARDDLVTYIRTGEVVEEEVIV